MRNILLYKSMLIIKDINSILTFFTSLGVLGYMDTLSEPYIHMCYSSLLQFEGQIVCPLYTFQYPDNMEPSFVLFRWLRYKSRIYDPFKRQLIFN